MTISCNQLLVRLGPRRGLKGFLGRRGRQCPAPISPDGRILAEVAPSSAEVEHAVDQAIGDSHCDGLWRYDPATRPISVYVLVCQAALIRDPRPGTRRVRSQRVGSCRLRPSCRRAEQTRQEDRRDSRREPGSRRWGRRARRVSCLARTMSGSRASGGSGSCHHRAGRWRRLTWICLIPGPSTRCPARRC